MEGYGTKYVKRLLRPRMFSQKEEEEAEPMRKRGHHRRFVLGSHSSVRVDLSYRLYPGPFFNASNEYVARYARS